MSDAQELAPQGESKNPQAVPGTAVPFGGTVTIFFSDIRGFTDYTEQFGDEAAYQILREHNAIVGKQIEAFGGVVVKTQGDSFMVAFTTARGAILCAVAIQRAIAEAHENQTGPRIAVGIGINTGEPIQEGGDYFGSMVNLAARICASAGPGQILVAETTRYVAGRVESVDYVDRGLHELKGFPEAKRLSEVVWRPADAIAQATGHGASAGGKEEAAAFKAAVQKAIGVLTRVLAVTHLDDPAFAPLLECQAKASEIRLALSRAAAERRPVGAKQVLEVVVPFENFLTLVVEGSTLSEERWAELDAAVARAFGRPLVTAAARRRLSGGTRERPEPAGEMRRQVAAPAAPPRIPVTQAITPPPLDPRAAGVRWWAAAYAAWSQWKLSGIGWAHALRGELGKYPYLLSVPIQESEDHDDGQLSGGYFLLLEHIENQASSFLRTALERALEGTKGAVAPDVLGPKLYHALVEGGRLRETYGALVREVIGIAIPNPGVWADGGMVEHEDATVAITRPSGLIGETGERPVRLTDTKERLADHSFTVTLEPLTARFFYVKPGQMKTPRDLHLKLVVDGKPSDCAWFITLKTSLVVRAEPRALPKDGVSLPGLGKDHAGAWVALFNADPDASGSYELVVGLRPPKPAGPLWSPFSPQGRRPR